jgi:hypothetical protein
MTQQAHIPLRWRRPVDAEWVRADAPAQTEKKPNEITD